MLRFSSRVVTTLAITITTFSCAQAASNAVTISGLLDLGVNTQNSVFTGQHTTGMNGASYTAGGLSPSYLGIGGTEDLGAGMKAGFALESWLRPGMGKVGLFDGDSFFSRQANVYLSGDFGSVKVGKQFTPLSYMDVFYDPFLFGPNYNPLLQHTYLAYVAGNQNSAAFSMSNAISYGTPDFKGLNATLLYSLSGQSGVSGTFSGIVNYFHDAFAASIAYEKSTVTGPSNDSFVLGGGYAEGTTQKILALGASYDFSPVKMYFMYQNTDTTIPGGSATKKNVLHLATTVKVGGGNVIGAVAYTGGMIDQKTFSIAYDYFLSKRTDLYAAYMRDQARAYTYAFNTMGIGMRHQF